MHYFSPFRNLLLSFLLSFLNPFYLPVIGRGRDREGLGLGWGIAYKRMEYKKKKVRNCNLSCVQQILFKHLLCTGSVHRIGAHHAPTAFHGLTWKGKRQVRYSLPGAFTQATKDVVASKQGSGR